MRTRITAVALLVLLGTAAVAWADLPRPPWVPRPDPNGHGYARPDRAVPVVVSVDDRATEARLIVPKNYLNRIAAGPAADDDTARAAVRPVRWPVIGIPIAAALAVGGL